MPKLARFAPRERVRPVRPLRVEHATTGARRDSPPGGATTGDPGVTVHVDADRVVVSGRLDMETTPLLDEILERQPGDDALELDLRGVTFLDSIGLRTLIGEATRRWGSTVTVRASSEVLRVLELTGTTVLFDVRPG